MDKADAGLSDELIEVLRQYYYMKIPLGLENFMQGEMKVLSYIHYNAGGGEIATGDIVSALDMTGGRVAGILRSLEKKGFISRRTDENDRRRIMVSPTYAGSDYVENGRELLRSRLSAIINAMGSESAENFIRSMEEFVNACRKADFP
ncbi:MAG: MarR family winged helix-turn-helix transcriptional regulator [Oscillospiraceae bacterium]